MNYFYISLILYLIIIFSAATSALKKSQEIKKKKSSNFINEYFLGSRSLNGFMLAMTVSATYISASSFIGGPSAAYKYGLSWVFLAMIQVPVALFSLGFLGKKIARLSHQYNLVTFNDLIFHKYQSKAVLFLSSFAILISFFAMMVVQFFGAGRLLEVVLGIEYQSAVIIFALTVLIYTLIGGFRAVVLTDTIQGIVMIIGSLILLGAVIYQAGGVEQATLTLSSIDPNLLSPKGLESSPFDFSFMLSFWFLVCFGILALPAIVVRNMAYQKSKSLHFAIIIGTIVISIVMFSMHLSGVFGRVILPNLQISDQIVPLLMIKTLPPIVAGIFLAAPMAAIMSSVDSLLIQSSSTIIKDLLLRAEPKLVNQEKTLKKITIIISILFTALLLLVSLNPPKMLVWINLNALGLIEASFFWVIVLGLCYKKANYGGAMFAMIGGMLSYSIMVIFDIKFMSFHSIIPAIIFSGVSFFIGNFIFTKKIDTMTT